MVVVVVLDFVVAGVVVVRLTVRVEVAAGVAAVRVLCVVAFVVVVFVVVVAFVAVPAAGAIALPDVPLLASTDGCVVVDEEVVDGAVEIDWPGCGNGFVVTEAIN